MATAQGDRGKVTRVIAYVLKGWFPKATDLDINDCAHGIAKILNVEELTDRQWMITLPEESSLPDFDEPDVLP